MSTHDEKLKLGQTRICAARFLPKTVNSLKMIKQSAMNNSALNISKLQAAFLTQFLWKKGSVITIGFMDGSQNVPRNTYDEIRKSNPNLEIDPLQKVIDSMSVIDGIKKIVTERFMPIVGDDIKLSFVDNWKTATIRISFVATDGAWSVIGNQALDPEVKGQATMNLGWIDCSTTCHEFGHAFGMIHEHQSPRNNTIQWNKEAVYTWAKNTQGWDKSTTDTNILDTYNTTQTNGSNYDPLSIMLYFFPASLTLNNQGTQQNLRFSGLDVLYINDSYPNSPQTPSYFYKNVFGEDINASIEDSKMLAEYVPQNNNMYILIGVILLILLFIAVAFILLRILKLPFSKTSNQPINK